MARQAFEQIMQGLLEVREIVEGRADPSTYRVHVPDPATGRMVHVPGMRIGPEPKGDAGPSRAGAALAARRRRRKLTLTHTALFDELYGRSLRGRLDPDRIAAGQTLTPP